MSLVLTLCMLAAGTYVWRVQELYEQCGPIVCISPNALHVNDPDFHDYAWALPHFNTPQAMVATAEYNHHRLRRSAVAQFFSKAKIRRFDYVLKDNIKNFLSRLQEFEENGGPGNTLEAFKALTSDILTTYAFGESHNYLDVKDFNQPFWDMFHELSHTYAISNHFPLFLPFMSSLPGWMQRSMGMENIMATIFRDLLNSSLPPEEKTIERMWHDCQMFNVARSKTTSWAFANCTFYLLNGTINYIATSELEVLPYLILIKESLRLSFGVAGRLYRISTTKTQMLKDGTKEWIIPAGTTVAMSNPLVSLNPKIFPSAAIFDPSRWLDNPQLDRYLVAFSKGLRGCVGLNLAWADLYFTVAAVFARGGGEERTMRLWKTSVEDVQAIHDFFVPAPRLDSKGVKVILSS
ncbi:cytochrome P450 [Stipitochalara longipes BDJ]|nr:cytochrome P450 [Stipitochalara longipes BDJ]